MSVQLCLARPPSCTNPVLDVCFATAQAPGTAGRRLLSATGCCLHSLPFSHNTHHTPPQCSPFAHFSPCPPQEQYTLPSSSSTFLYICVDFRAANGWQLCSLPWLALIVNHPHCGKTAYTSQHPLSYHASSCRLGLHTYVCADP